MKVLLAIDGTKYAEAARDMLKSFSLKGGDSIHVISVVDMAVPLAVEVYGGYLPDSTELEKNARDFAAKTVEEAADSLKAFFAGVEVTTDILFGSPGSRIVETAEELSTDLIVLGSHGHKRWERLLLGSVSSSVVNHAHCSVLVVRIRETAA
ncbi:MAG: universal stress protein [Chloracidobacterium sp.]|nr:universal stress protein [Chloracidobacterium sp.]MCO5333996.1 universal stress protein [Pyrinomonadaceae bacterium]